MSGSAEAAGLALCDTLYRKQTSILGWELPHETGERFEMHLARRGYRVVYDPALAEQAARTYETQKREPAPVRDTRPQPKPIPDDTVVKHNQLVAVGNVPVACAECGNDFFDVLASGKYRCTACGVTYRGWE